MEYSEKKFPLTEEDIKFLRGKRNRVFIIIAVIEILFAAFPVSYILYPEVYPDDFGIFIWVATGICYLVFCIIMVFFNYRFQSDLRSGRKLHIEAILVQKEKITSHRGVGKNRSSSTSYWFKFGQKNNLIVDWHTFKKAEDGDFVKMEIAEQSGTVLNIESTKRF